MMIRNLFAAVVSIAVGVSAGPVIVDAFDPPVKIKYQDGGEKPAVARSTPPNPTPPKARTEGPKVAKSRVEKVVVEETASDPLTPDGDNQPALQAFFDSLPAGSEVELPAGVWPLSTELVVNKRLTIKSEDSGIAELKCTSAADQVRVLRIGNYGGGVKVSGVVLKRLSFTLASTGVNNLQNCIVAYGDNLRFEKCLWQGAAHEGVVVHGDSQFPYFLDCTGRNCGKGNGFYQLTTAAFNSHANDTTYQSCVAYDSGQGFEMGGTRMKALACIVYECNIAFNVGSHVSGVVDCEVAFCSATSSKVGAAGVIFGNGIGKLRNINIHHNTFVNAAVTGMGGKLTNHVPYENDGPSSGVSHIDDNVFIALSMSHSGLAGYSTGPGGEETAVFGRESMTINRNRFYFMTPKVEVHHPTIYVAGHITGSVEVKDNEVHWSDAAQLRGDFQSFWSKPETPLALTISGNKAFRIDRTEREFTINLEVPQ